MSMTQKQHEDLRDEAMRLADIHRVPAHIFEREYDAGGGDTAREYFAAIGNDEDDPYLRIIETAKPHNPRKPI